MDQHYSQHCWERIRDHTAVHGTPTGCPELDPEDEATATEIYCQAMPAIDPGDSAWDLPVRPSVASLRALPPDLDDEEFQTLWDAACANHDADDEAAELARHWEPAPDDRPDPAPFEPSAEDLDDYDRWSMQVQARRLGILPVSGGSPEEALLDEMRAWYRRHPISEFNAIRTD